MTKGLTWPDVLWPHLIWSDLIWPDLTWPHLIWSLPLRLSRCILTRLILSSSILLCSRWRAINQDCNQLWWSQCTDSLLIYSFICLFLTFVFSVNFSLLSNFFFLHYLSHSFSLSDFYFIPNLLSLFSYSASLSICLPAYLCVSVFPHVCPCVWLPDLCVCACLSVLCLSVCLTVCVSLCLPICLSTCLTLCVSACLSVWLTVCLSDCLCVCLFVCLTVCPGQYAMCPPNFLSYAVSFSIYLTSRSSTSPSSSPFECLSIPAFIFSYVLLLPPVPPLSLLPFIYLYLLFLNLLYSFFYLS